MYHKVATDMNFVAREKQVTEMWKEKDFSSPALLHGIHSTIYVEHPGARTVY